MLIRAIMGVNKGDELRDRFVKDMGATDWDAPWPLPNARPSSETEFWGWLTTWGPRAYAWTGQRKIGDDFANVLVFYMDVMDMQNGGFAIVVFRRYQQERVEYFRWGACQHEFENKTIGNCLHRYTCKKCGATHDVDSSG
ncbi:MAG TPA: hypothetical protein VHN20_10810 [Beijerinckiaceae bacterium]|nr:hypothetical protein [Beijerinckiaceae bacterium]